MAIVLPYETLNPAQTESVRMLLARFRGEVSQCSLHGDSAQVVLNKGEITPERGQMFLDELILILGSNRWGTDLPTRSNEPPECYTSRYKLDVPFDPSICNS
jgi:hypothetical protein